MRNRLEYWLVLAASLSAFAGIAQAQEPGQRPEVLQLIAAGIESACKSAEKDCSQIRQSYQRMFLSGFISPGESYGQQDWRNAAYTAGNQYRRAHPADFSRTMADLGYPVVTGIEGRWAVSFEVSAFTPSRKFDGKWWVSGLEGVIRYLPSKQALDSAGDEHSASHERSIRISGYLNRACAEQLVTGRKSTEKPSGSSRTLGGYGHLGAYECEIHATEIELLPEKP